MPYRVPIIDEGKARDEEEIAAFARKLHGQERSFRTVRGVLAAAAATGLVARIVVASTPITDGTLWIWASGQSTADRNGIRYRTTQQVSWVVGRLFYRD